MNVLLLLLIMAVKHLYSNNYLNYFHAFISKYFCVFSFYPYLVDKETPEHSDSGLAVPQESSRQEPPPPPTEEPQSQILSSLRLENQLLRSEVASLNQEMASVIQRAKDVQDGKCLDKTGKVIVHISASPALC